MKDDIGPVERSVKAWRESHGGDEDGWTEWVPEHDPGIFDRDLGWLAGILRERRIEAEEAHDAANPRHSIPPAGWYL